MTAPLRLADIKDRLVGLDGWLAAAARASASYTDQKIERLIPKWIRRFERECQFRVYPVQVCNSPDGTYNQGTTGAGTVSCQGDQVTGVGTAFDTLFTPGQTIQAGGVGVPILSIENATSLTLVEEGPSWSGQTYQKFALPVISQIGYPFYPGMGDEFFVTTLRERPVREIQRMRLMFNGQALIYQVPANWICLDGKVGRVWMLPYYGQVTIAGGAAALALYAATFASMLPNFLQYDYVAGLPDGWEYTAEWSDLKIVLSEYCALQVLNDVSQAVNAGMQGKSLSVDGMSQTMNYDRFEGRKKELSESVAAFKETLVAQETPFLLDFV